MTRAATCAAAVRAALCDVLDLALPATCAGCGLAPGLLCGSCRRPLAGPAREAWPDPVPPGLPPPRAVVPYLGAVRTVVIAHKEDGRRALATPLGDALATSVRSVASQGARGPAAAGDSLAGSRLLLVPMPSRAAAVRARGHDPTRAMARAAARSLRRDGQEALVVPVLRLARSVTDQAGLGAAARAVNLADAVRVPRRLRRVLSQLVDARPTVVVLVDDVITTGSSLAAAAAALRRAGIPVAGCAVVAATPRRRSTRARRTTRGIGAPRTRPGQRSGAGDRLRVPGVLPGAQWG
ncbi:MAG: ComF family protein [Actinomycetes bacterium]